jgi:arylsulfatase A-like enzyme
LGEGAGSVRGAAHFAITLRLAIGAWVGCILLQFILYLRPSPYGGPFLLRWKIFIIRALAYELLSTWLIALPFLLLWLLLYRRPLRSPHWHFVHWGLIALMALNLLITAFDHELYRFLGLRLGPNFMNVYADPMTLADSLFLNVLRGDRGGPFLSPVLCIGAPALYLWWSIRMTRRRLRAQPPLRLGLRFAVAALVLPLAVGQGSYSLAHAKFRLSRLEPALFAVIRDYSWRYDDDNPPGDARALGRAWQAEWLAGTTDRNWRFPDPDRPYVRIPIDPSSPAPQDRWNVIMIQLESVRGVDTGYLRPSPQVSATPYLDSLARRPDAAVWTRALSFGPPSINGRFALQCSIMPTSRRFITNQTRSTFYCLPDALRRQGYRTEMFSSGDIDMDNSTLWIMRMYDRLWRYPEEGQRDRAVFRHATERIREMGRQGPFLASLISATNHHPFSSPEPQLDVAGQDDVRERIRNTTRYTDDVVREFIESLRGEPWFSHTIFVINSDHAYNLGEHGGMIGALSLYQESVWIPFVIVGPHPRLPVGRHDELATLLDVAPTIADLLGLREANPWQGHSLLALKPGRRILFGFGDSVLAETQQWTALLDGQDGRVHLYSAGGDWLEQHDAIASNPALARSLIDEADRKRRFNDYVLHRGLLWAPTASPPHAADSPIASAR